jgi:hypothetical protein
MLMRFDDVASRIVSADHCIMVVFGYCQFGCRIGTWENVSSCVRMKSAFLGLESAEAR